MLRPKDVTDQLNISAPTLRVWSNTFAPVLSPAAQSARTESGGAAQRRYTDQDVAYFRKAKALLDNGLTFEQTLEALQALDPGELEQAVEPIASAPFQDPIESTSSVPVVIEPTHPIIQAFEETLRTKDQVIAGKDDLILALHQTIADKENYIHELREREPIALPAPTPPAPEPPRFRWGFLNWLFAPPVTVSDNQASVDSGDH